MKLALTALVLASSLASAAQDAERPGLDEYNLNKRGLALGGYDPVAYFTRGVATPGAPEHAVVHDGATFYFASAEHAKAFRKSPGKYAPAYGGYCAFGVSVGKKFDGNPAYWLIEDGRLYLNLNAEIARMFRADVAGALAKAERQWAKIEHEAVGSL